MPDSPVYPLNLRLRDRRVLVVGGGAVAQGRVERLLEAGARVTVVGPTLTPGLAQRAAHGDFAHRAGAVRADDLDGQTLVLACADDDAVDRDVVRWAHERGLLVHVADAPAQCDFTFPAVFRRGAIVLTVSSSGQCPGYAADLRERLGAFVDEAECQALAIVAQQRERLRQVCSDPQRRAAAVRALISAALAEVIRTEGLEAAQALAEETVARLLDS